MEPKTVTIRLDYYLWCRLKKFCLDRKTTISRLAEMLLRHEVERVKKN